MADSGLRVFTSEEASNLLAGQGYAYNLNALNTGAYVVNAGSQDFENIVSFCAIRNVATMDSVGTCIVKARSLIGDDFSTTGVYSTGSGLNLAHGDTIYGCFDKIELSTSDGILLYVGKFK
jgi:hypothetical protein